MIYTTIYWLVDTRPETIAAGWPDGLPFYCGMTKRTLTEVLRDMRNPRVSRTLSEPELIDRIRLCGKDVRVDIKEVVPPLGGKKVKLKKWMVRLKQSYPQPVQRNKTPNTPRAQHSSSKREAWLERQRNVMLRSGKLPPPPY